MRAGGAEQHALGHDDAAAAIGQQAVEHVFDEEDFGRSRGADLNVFTDTVFVQSAGKRRIGGDDVMPVGRQAQLTLGFGVERGGQYVALANAHIGQATQGEVHGGEANHFRVNVVAEEGLLLQDAPLGRRKCIAVAALDALALDVHGLDAVGRRVGKLNVVEDGGQKARRAGCRVVGGFADFRVEHGDDSADNVARGAELAEFASRLDLLQHMFEQVALGVGVGFVEAQAIDLADYLRQHHRLVDHQSRAVHEVDRAACGDFGIEGENLIAQEADQILARESPSPMGPAETVARNAAQTTHRGCVERVAQLPVADVNAFGGLLHQPGACLRLGVEPVGKVEEKQEGQLLGVGHRVGIAASKQVVADDFNVLAALRGEGHEFSLMGCRRAGRGIVAGRVPINGLGKPVNEGAQGVFAAKELDRAALAALQAERREFEVIEREVVELFGVLANLRFNIEQPAFLCRREVTADQPALEAHAEFVGLFLGSFEKDEIASIIHCDPGAGGRVDFIVLIDGNQRARVRAWAGRAVDDVAALAVTIFALMSCGNTDKIEQREDRFALCLAGSPATHLAVQRDGLGISREDQIDHFRAVEAGIEHVHRHQYLRKFLLLEAANPRHAVSSVFALPHAGNNVIGVFDLRRGLEVGKFAVDHGRQRFGVAFGDGKDDSLTEEGLAENTLAVGVALVHDLAELSNDGLIARRNREFALQRIGINQDMRLRGGEIRSGGEGVFKLLARPGIEAIPLNIFAQCFDAVSGRGLDGPGFVNLVADQIALVDGALERVGKGWLIHAEKTQSVADESCFIVGRSVVVGRLDAGCCGQTDLDAVKVFQHLAPLAVNAAVAFVSNHEVEISGRILVIDIDHRLQGGDGDALLVLKATTSPEHVARQILEVFGKGILGLQRQWDAVHQEKHPADDIGRKQALDERGGGSRLAGAGGHFYQQLAATKADFSAQRFNAILLVVAAGNGLVDVDTQRIDTHLPHGGTAFKVELREEGSDRTRVRFTLPVPKQDFLAVGEEDERHVRHFGVVPPLLGGVGGVDGFALGFDNRQAPSLTTAQQIVGTVAIGQSVFIAHADAIADVPALVFELGVDESAGKGFGLRHAVLFWICRHHTCRP